MRRFAARRSAAAMAAVSLLSFVALCCLPSASVAQVPLNGTRTVKGEINAVMNGFFSHNPTYLRATRISQGGSSTPTATDPAPNAVECFKHCALTVGNATASTSACYAATFTPSTGACDIFYKTPATTCPSLVVTAASATTTGTEPPSSVLLPWRYTRIAEACITVGPAFKDGPPFELPAPRVALDASIGLAVDSTLASIVQGTTVFDSPDTTLTYLGSTANMVSPAVCTGICERLKRGANWTDEPTDFSNSWAAAEGYYGVPKGLVTNECVVTSHYNAAAAYSQSDDSLGYVCDLWGTPAAVTTPATPASFDARPQEPGGRNAATVLMTKRWERLVTSTTA